MAVLTSIKMNNSTKMPVQGADPSAGITNLDLWFKGMLHSLLTGAEVENTTKLQNLYSDKNSSVGGDLIAAIKTDIFNQMYPVGSIYISTNMDTVEKVNGALGGQWERWGKGRVPVGVNDDSEKSDVEGGSKEIKLSANNLPEHHHELAYDTFTANTTPGSTNDKLYSGLYPYAMSGSGTGGTFTGSYFGNDEGKMSNKTNTYAILRTHNLQDSSRKPITTATESINVCQPYVTCYMYRKIKDASMIGQETNSALPASVV